MSSGRIIIIASILGAAWIASAQPGPRGGAGTGSGSAGSASGSGSADDDLDDDDDDGGDLGSGADTTRAPATGLDVLDRTRATPVGFDHLQHDLKLVVGVKDSLGCASCHPVRGRGELVGRPDHRGCFGAGGACHGASPTRKNGVIDVGDRGRVCAACHAPAALVRASTRGGPRLAIVYPPYRLDRDYGLSMSHPRHATMECTTCHPSTATTTKRPAAHTRCTGCHDGTTAAPAMTACAGCHLAAYGTASGPTQVPARIPVTFDHASHGRRAPKTACTRCHAAVATTEGIELPRPAMTDCAGAGCHGGGGAAGAPGGKAAFPVTGACTRCHASRPVEWKVERADDRFSHVRHAERIGTADCASCHRLAAGGDAVTIGHTACANTACHESDFSAREPITCTSCHVGSEPWRKLTADQYPREETELGARLPHDRHRQACTACHVRPSASRELRPPRGHASCTGGACHKIDAGPTPRLADCTGCHQLGLVEARNALRLAAKWSTRARFRHAAHVRDPQDHSLVACESCHDAVATSGALADVPTPSKARCASCHDGGVAFKLTGTGCARCHGKAETRP